MRFAVFAAVTAMFAGLTGPATAALDAVTVPQMHPAPVSAQTLQHLPSEAMSLGDDIELSAIDRAKMLAETQGIYVAASQTVLTDGKFAEATALEANVVTLQSLGHIDPMNLRFYGTLLIFAAGCMMYLGLTIRRHP